LAGATSGPLVIGSVGPDPQESGILLADVAQGPNQITPVGQVAFSDGDAVAAANVGVAGQMEIVQGIGTGMFITDRSGVPITPESFGFQEPLLYSQNGFLALGDVNGDGVADIVTTSADSNGTNHVVVYMANGAQPIPAAVTDQLAFHTGGAIVVCDFDGDGVDDVIVAPSFTMYSGKTGTVSQVPGAPTNFLLGDSLACGDLNGDLFEDLVIGFPGEDNPNTGAPGAGSFEVASEGPQPVNFFPASREEIPFVVGDELVAGDLDGDGVAELVVGHHAGGMDAGVSIFSAPGATPPLDPTGIQFLDGTKLAIPRFMKPIQEPTTVNITIPYVLAYILYDPPGDQSSVNYVTGTSLGTTSTVTTTTAEGVSVSLKIPLVMSGGGGNGTPQTATTPPSASALESVNFTQSSIVSSSLTTTETSTFSVKAPAKVDAPNRDFDRFYVSLNVQGTRTDFHDGQPPSVTLDMSSGPFVELLGAWLFEIANGLPTTLKDPTLAQQVFSAITTPEEAAGLLAMDPNYTGEDITQEPGRFAPFVPTLPIAQTTNVVGLPHPAGTGLDGGLPGASTTQYFGSTATGTGMGNGNTVSASYGAMIPIGPFTVGASYSVTVNSVTTTTTTTTSSDSITLGSDTLCEQGTIALYRDMLFGGSFITRQPGGLSNPCLATKNALSFEVLADWQVQGGGSASLSGVSAAGAESLSVTAAPGGWTPIVSIPLSSSVLREVATSSDLAKVSFALSIPTTQPNPYWVGDAQMFISSPTANVFNQPLGEVNLTGLPEGQFNRIEFTIPDNALPAIAGDNPDVTFTIVLNVNAGTSGWLVDDLQIGN